jgi:hypothetical protein
MKAIVTECYFFKGEEDGYHLTITLYNGETGVVSHLDNKEYPVGSHIEVKLVEESDTNFYVIV